MLINVVVIGIEFVIFELSGFVFGKVVFIDVVLGFGLVKKLFGVGGLELIGLF